MDILDEYVTKAPSAQHALDIFKGEWVSSLPPELNNFTAGSIPLFQDGRIDWAVAALGGVQGARVLELGPLEAGHTYMLHKMGAESILAIEANTRAYIKCLIIKELLQLKRAEFLLGDFVAYLAQNNKPFDLCIASGVLYHMKQPAELLYLLAQITDKIMLWTHYYNPDNAQFNPHLFEAKITADYRGFKHNLYRQNYRTENLTSKIFCGGMQNFSCWMTREDILRGLDYYGFKRVQINFETIDHPHGSCFTLVAEKS
jgi:hypothetical protein